MRATIGLMAAAGLVWSVPAVAQDVAAMSPRDLYIELYVSENGIACTEAGDPSTEARDNAYHDRFLKVRPWLVAEIGEAAFETLEQNLLDEEADVDYFGCPTDQQLWRADYRHNRVLQEMERRARSAQRGRRQAEARLLSRR